VGHGALSVGEVEGFRAVTDYTAGDLVERLRRQHKGDAWAFFSEVPDGTGWNKSRTIDALAMSLWASRGLKLHGFEIKVSRGDWLRELRNASKADDFVNYCDHFWIVAPREVVLKGELPPTWGLLVPKGAVLSVAHIAPPLKPMPIDRVFLAALCRQVHRATPSEAALKAAYKRGHEEGVKASKESREWSDRQDLKELAELRAAVEKFEAATGLHFSRYDATPIARAVKLAHALGNDGIERALEYSRNTLRGALTRLDEVATEHEKSPVKAALASEDEG
jgi:hypothetical protein